MFYILCSNTKLQSIYLSKNGFLVDICQFIFVEYSSEFVFVWNEKNVHVEGPENEENIFLIGKVMITKKFNKLTNPQQKNFFTQ